MPATKIVRNVAKDHSFLPATFMHLPHKQLFGRRWLFSTDFMPLPAAIALFFHFAWTIIMLVGAAASRAWPGSCSSGDGIQYIIIFSIFFGTFVAASIIDVLLIYHGAKGAPFEESQRTWVVPLLYAGSVPLVIQFGTTLYGSWATTTLQADCWPEDRQEAVATFARALVFCQWVFFLFCALGIILFLNMYESSGTYSWEQRCKCIATLLCCKQDILRRPDGRRPPLKNIAELTSGLLSHVDLDVSDIAAAIMLTSAAQQRRRRLRIAKALLPVYRALRGRDEDGRPPSGMRSETTVSEPQEENDSAVGAASSDDDDVPSDPKVTHMLLHENQGTKRAQSAPLGNTRTAFRSVRDIRQRSQRHVSFQLPQVFEERNDMSTSGVDAFIVAGDSTTSPPTRIKPDVMVQLPPTERNVAAMESLTLLHDVAKGRGGDGRTDDMACAAAGAVAQDVLSAAESQDHAPDAAGTIDQLATAIQVEMEQLGAGALDEGIISVKKEESLDLAELQFDPEHPNIWFHPEISVDQSDHGESGGCLHEQSSLDLEVGLADVAEVGDVIVEEGGRSSIISGDKSENDAEKDEREADTAAAAAAAAFFASIESYRSDGAAVGASSRSQQRSLPPSTSAIPSDLDRDDAVNQHADSVPLPPARESDTMREETLSTATCDQSARESAPAPSVVSQSEEIMSRAITLLHPTVITPSEHVEEFVGPLSPEALAEVYAGRHEAVPADQLRFALRCLRFAYGVYSLQPDIEKSRGCMDVACFTPPDPQAVVYKALDELEAVAKEESVELLHLNCSNKVLAHLPYLIALDHAAQTVVLAIRGTISLSDLVTDAVVHPELVNDWLPDRLKTKVQGPALAHSGMLAASRAIFEDLQTRGILPGLTDHREDAVLAPEQQCMSDDGGSVAGRDTMRAEGSAHDSSGGAAYNVEGRVHGDDDSIGSDQRAVGEKVGNIMRDKVENEGWQFMVVGHSLGGGTAALMSLKLLDLFPDLKCIAFSAPGACVSRNLAHAMAPFCTTLAAGKDAVPRSSVATVARLMDEMVTALARCRQPKWKVLSQPWWRRNKQRFRELFFDYKDIPPEAAAALYAYYESRQKLGQPVSMYPPGKVIFLRPLKLRRKRKWNAVYIAPEDLMKEGILISPTMLTDHLCSTVHAALVDAVQRAEAQGTPVPSTDNLVNTAIGRAVRAPFNKVKDVAKVYLSGGGQRQRQNSLEEVLVQAQ